MGEEYKEKQDIKNINEMKTSESTATSFVQQAINKQIDELNSNSEDKQILYDPLKLYFGEDYIIDDKIVIHQCTIQDFIDIGEDNIYSTISPFTANTTTYRVILWDMGIDWNKISDYELFMMLSKTLNPEYSKVFFGDIDFSKFDIYTKQEEIDGNPVETVTFYNEEQDIEIDEATYKKISDYMRYMFKANPEEEFASGKRFKQELIDNDRLKMLKKQKEKKNDSNMLSMISFCLNHPGFKYKKNELREVGIVEFMDSVSRLQIYESTRALFSGMYSGFCDVSKIDKDNFNFMRDIKIDND